MIIGYRSRYVLLFKVTNQLLINGNHHYGQLHRYFQVLSCLTY